MDVLVGIKSRKAVEKAYDHGTFLLCADDDNRLGIRNLVPALLLRLSEDTDCFHCLVWWMHEHSVGSRKCKFDTRLRFVPFTRADIHYLFIERLFVHIAFAQDSNEPIQFTRRGLGMSYRLTGCRLTKLDGNSIAL